MTSSKLNSEKQIYSRLGPDVVTTIGQAIAAGSNVTVDLKNENYQQFGRMCKALECDALFSSVRLTKVGTTEADDV